MGSCLTQQSTIGLFALNRPETFTAPTISIEVHQSGASGQRTFIGTGTPFAQTTGVAWDGASLVAQDAGGTGGTTTVAATPGDGDYVLRHSVSGGVLTATLLDITGTTVLFTAAVTLVGASATAMTSPHIPLFLALPGPTTWGTFFADDGTIGPPPPSGDGVPGLVFSITTLRYPTVEPARVRRLVQFTGGEVTYL